MTGVGKISEVRYLKEVKGLPIKEIVRRLNLSRNTIRKILRSKEVQFTYQREEDRPVIGRIQNLIKSWIKDDQLEKKRKRRTAQRMYDMLVSEYKYEGSYRSVANYVQEIKKELELENKEAYIPLEYDPGEAFQFDWGEVTAYIGKKLVVLQLGVIELCYSRHFYARVYPCQKQELMLDVHRRAFEYFGGVCERGIYDNLKSAVKQLLKGHHRNLQERFVLFCSYYLYKPEFCNPAKGNEKGRVENMVGYIKRNFFIPTPQFESLKELNERLLSFAISTSRKKEQPEIAGKTRYEAYEKEKEVLIELPGYGFDCCRTTIAIVSPYSMIFYDNNRYSVPAEYVGKSVLVKGYADKITVSYGGKEIASHKRVFGYKQQIFDPYHYLGILLRKPRAFKDGKPFRNWHLPEVFMEYRKQLKDRYPDGDKYFAKTLILLKDWTLKEVTEAVEKAIKLRVLGDSYILTLLRQNKEINLAQKKINISEELNRYRAQQRPLSDYDDMLRYKNKKQT
jgi:transposase